MAEEKILVTSQNIHEVKAKCIFGGKTLVRITKHFSAGERISFTTRKDDINFEPDSIGVGDEVLLRTKMAFRRPARWLSQFSEGVKQILFECDEQQPQQYGPSSPAVEEDSDMLDDEN